MKRFATIWILAVLLLGAAGSILANQTAPYSYPFDTWPNATIPDNVDGWLNETRGSYSTTPYIHGTTGKSVKFQGANDYIVSPAIDNPNELHIWTYGNASTVSGVFQISASLDSTNFWVIRDMTWGVGNDIQPTTWNEVIFTVPDSCRGKTRVFFKFQHVTKTSGNVALDDFSITAVVASAEADARLSIAGVGASPSISSLLVAAPGQTVLTFGVQDDGSGAAGLPTIINSLKIVAGSGNTATNWTQYIGGVTLEDGLGNSWTGTVSSTPDIIFSGAPLTTLPDGGVVQTWTMKLWLKQGLPYNGDNKVLAFKAAVGNFVVASSGSATFAADPAVESGTTNNMTNVVATQLSFTTMPVTTWYVDSTFATVRGGFTDVYGGIDADFNENITISLNTGTGVLSTASPTKLSTSGQSAWTDLKYNTVESGVIFQLVSPTYPTPVLSNPITILSPPSIVIDCMPTCFDTVRSADAVPFVIHISIRNWITEANKRVYVKVYNGSFNPYHYTASQGWNNSTSYGVAGGAQYKPVVSLDENGDWSGWLAIRGTGQVCDTFRARAADSISTSINLSGALVSGTGLNLSTSGNGAIIEDRNGSSLATPGHIILARNAANTIIGSWIAEDNGYPTDDGGPIAPGGWRMAVCTFCDEPVYFEAWDPATWPGSGEPFMTDGLDNFCADPGTINEVFDIQLPVELASFTAIGANGKVSLNWETASESNNDYFEIVRNGTPVANVRGAGSSATTIRYSWTDESVQNGTTYSYTLVAVDGNNVRSELRTVEATPMDMANVVTEYALHQNYPNPFNPTTTIAYDIVETGFVSLKIFNLMGQAVATLVNDQVSAGHHFVTFDAASLPSGLYICKMEAGEFSAQSKMMLMK
ncbi:T9SS C-terminal target domain-containing protein [candidate division KSB1 bacterium]|nr:MAG: T9SS C-terminal target domain-containing protein [candidate division KSB1 bacterium]